MFEPFFLIDKGKKVRLNRIRAHEVAVKIAIKYGCVEPLLFKEAWIKELWDFNDNYPAPSYFVSNVQTSNIFKILQTSFSIEEETWNQDFMNGVARNCKITNALSIFPLIKWLENKNVKKIISITPFGITPFGDRKKQKKQKSYKPKRKCKNKTPDNSDNWMLAPVLAMSYDEKSLSFIAGVLVGGVIVKRKTREDGTIAEMDKIVKGKIESLVLYKNEAINIIKKLNIPIEHETKTSVLISPIWPALFTLKMPVEVRESWLNVKRPYKVKLYAPILWRSYVRRNAISKGIPYLRGKRAILYQFKCEEGAMKRIENLRFKLGLTSLDACIREMVQMWAKKSKVIPRC